MPKFDFEKFEVDASIVLREIWSLLQDRLTITEVSRLNAIFVSSNIFQPNELAVSKTSEGLLTLLHARYYLFTNVNNTSHSEFKLIFQGQRNKRPMPLISSVQNQCIKKFERKFRHILQKVTHRNQNNPRRLMWTV